MGAFCFIDVIVETISSCKVSYLVLLELEFRRAMNMQIYSQSSINTYMTGCESYREPCYEKGLALHLVHVHCILSMTLYSTVLNKTHEKIVIIH